MSDQAETVTRPAKRPRASEDDSSYSHSPQSNSPTFAYTDLNLQRHPEIWFDDGSIVLVARGTAFRIYRGLLASQSPVFAETFAPSTSGPDKAGKTFDGCPAVQVDDSPCDLAHLLRLLLPQSTMYFHPTGESPGVRHTFDQISAIIRLAHKYRIPQIQDQALSLLQEFWYTSSFYIFTGPRPDRDIDIRPVHAIGAVNLARLTDTPSMLPLALYECAHLDGGALFDGWTREDGTVERLSDADLRRCLDARVELAHLYHAVLSHLFCGAAHERCRQPSLCETAMRELHHKATHAERRVRYAITDWRDSIRELEMREALCWRCAGEILDNHEKERRAVFDRLPEIFGITVEGWGPAGAETDSEGGDQE
ncbi:hypothetical protein GSI_12254 [Ganoderma sinense ZZ0214-1]|uniref:BTB domain-containing protein n=1 Tax=Ganoderma sinense ZZ0214-1 TaxID=1077348 RepID=A0A2G8RYA3_9APHY|nr:hypothetical protein GSI_12254 [Ganoderma sinense ZZ0214-1]